MEGTRVKVKTKYSLNTQTFLTLLIQMSINKSDPGALFHSMRSINFRGSDLWLLISGGNVSCQDLTAKAFINSEIENNVPTGIDRSLAQGAALILDVCPQGHYKL